MRVRVMDAVPQQLHLCDEPSDRLSVPQVDGQTPLFVLLLHKAPLDLKLARHGADGEPAKERSTHLQDRTLHPRRRGV